MQGRLVYMLMQTC